MIGKIPQLGIQDAQQIYFAYRRDQPVLEREPFFGSFIKGLLEVTPGTAIHALRVGSFRKLGERFLSVN